MGATKLKAPGREGTGRGTDEHVDGALNTEYSKRPAPGEVVAVHDLPGRFVVTSNSDPSLVTLENENGVLLRVGERQVIRLGGER